VEDHGKGIHLVEGQTGIGLVAMRERAEILDGTLKVSPLASSGTLLHLEIPREQVEPHAE